MSKAFRVLGVAVVVAITCTALFAQGKKSPPPRKELIFIPADKLSYTDVIPGVSKAVVWGDPAVGRYGAFTEFVRGYDGGMHKHSNDVWLVVLRGAYLYKDSAGEKRVGPGDFIKIPAGRKHWSGGDASQGAYFYEEASGKFDLVPVK